jgi:hypothetical protein
MSDIFRPATLTNPSLPNSSMSIFRNANAPAKFGVIEAI